MMAIQTSPTYSSVAQEQVTISGSIFQTISNAFKVLVGIELAVIVVMILGRLIKSAPGLFGSSTTVDESLTQTIALFLIYIAPYAAYITCSRTARSQVDTNRKRQITVALATAAIIYAIVSMGQVVFEVGPYAERPSFGFSLRKVENGARIESLVKDGAAKEAGVELGDVIVGIRRAELTYEELQDALSEAGFEDVVRLRILRGEEEMQFPVSPLPAIEITLNGILTRFGIALLFTVTAFYWRGQLTPYVLLVLSLLPLLFGYFWLFVSTLSRRTEGLIPVNIDGNVGGFTLDHWKFITKSENNILSVTLNTFTIAITMVVLVLLVSSMAGYALSRMKFAGRRSFLSLTLILHGFPAVTLLLAVFFVLQNISKIPRGVDYTVYIIVVLLTSFFLSHFLSARFAQQRGSLTLALILQGLLAVPLLITLFSHNIDYSVYLIGVLLVTLFAGYPSAISFGKQRGFLLLAWVVQGLLTVPLVMTIFLVKDSGILTVTLETLMAVTMLIVVVLSTRSMIGYARSRAVIAGQTGLLNLSLAVSGFLVALLAAIAIVALDTSDLPDIKDAHGYAIIILLVVSVASYGLSLSHLAGARGLLASKLILYGLLAVTVIVAMLYVLKDMNNIYAFLDEDRRIVRVTLDTLMAVTILTAMLLSIRSMTDYARSRAVVAGQTDLLNLSLAVFGFLVALLVAIAIFALDISDLPDIEAAHGYAIIMLLVVSVASYGLSLSHLAGARGLLASKLTIYSLLTVTIIVAMLHVLKNAGDIYRIGEIFGFNTRGGIALVLVAFELPLGIWLMKGFFDGIPWDMERSALIDGASRWRTFWEILLPQIRPGLLALGIFSFITGWGAYLIPATYSVGTKSTTLTVLLKQLTDETAPTEWGQIGAIGLFQMIPVMLIFIFAQEYLLDIYAGGSKGSS